MMAPIANFAVKGWIGHAIVSNTAWNLHTRTGILGNIPYLHRPRKRPMVYPDLPTLGSLT